MYKLVIALAMVAFLASPVLAQDEAKESFLDRLSAGGGSMFAEEDESFSRDSLFLAFQARGMDIPMADGGYSGFGLELGFPNEHGAVYQLFSINRSDVPGVSNLYGGMDFKFGTADGFGSYAWDYDSRLVVGYRLGKAGPGNLRLEIYSLEEGRPLSFAFLYSK